MADDDKPSFTLVKAGEIASENTHYKLLIYGQSGAGKTHLGAKAPGVLHVPLESQAVPTIRRANPEALVAEIEDMDGFRDLMRACRSGSIPKTVRTIVIDSLTELQRMIMDDIRFSKTKNKGVFSKADWGTLANRLHAVMRLLRDLPYHVIVLALAKSETVDEVRRVAPAVKGSIGSELPGYFNAVGYAYKLVSDPDSDEPEIKHLVMFEAGEEYVVKPFGDLTGVVSPEPDAWIRMLEGEADRDEVAPKDAEKPAKKAAAKRRRKPRGAAAKKADSDESDGDGDDSNTEPEGGF